jgi:hypothetical protein
MNAQLTPELIQKADGFLDQDQQHQAAIRLGERMYDVFTKQNKERGMAQIRNLQQIAVSATRFADIEDFVKNQMGRNAGAYEEWRQVGDEVLQQLETLRRAVNDWTNDEGQRLLLRLHLARGWVRAVVGAYLYRKAQREMKREPSHA